MIKKALGASVAIDLYQMRQLLLEAGEALRNARRHFLYSRYHSHDHLDIAMFDDIIKKIDGVPDAQKRGE